MSKHIPEFFKDHWAETQGVKEHIWENKNVGTCQNQAFAPKLITYLFIMKRARIPQPINCVVPKSEELDDSTYAEDEEDHGGDSKESSHH